MAVAILRAIGNATSSTPLKWGLVLVSAVLAFLALYVLLGSAMRRQRESGTGGHDKPSER